APCRAPRRSGTVRRTSSSTMEQAWLSIISKGLRMIALAGVFMNGNMSAMRQMHSQAGQSASALTNDTADRTPARDTKSAGERHGRRAMNSPCAGAASSGSPGLVRLTDGVHLPLHGETAKKKPRPVSRSGFFIWCLTMTYSHMGKPHTTIGDASFHF